MISEVKKLNKGDLTIIEEAKIVRVQARSFSKKEGKFLSVMLGDASDQIEMKVWEDKDSVFSKFLSSVGGVVKALQVKVDEYQNAKSLVFSRFGSIEPPKDNLAPIEDVAAKLQASVSLIDEFFRPVVKSAVAKIYETKWPAAPMGCGFHGDCEYGLLRHTEGVLALALVMADRSYLKVHRSDLVAGILLHDVGKLMAYEKEGTRKSREGVLFDHVLLGLAWYDEKIQLLLSKRLPLVNTPEDREIAASIENIRHVIASHHAEYKEVVMPATIEAVRKSVV